MFRFPSVICTRCTDFFCLAIIKGPPNDIYCIIEEPYKHYFTEKVSYSLYEQYLMTCTNKKYIFLLTTTLTISVTEIPKHVDDKNTDFLAELLSWSDMLPENIRKPQKANGK